MNSLGKGIPESERRANPSITVQNRYNPFNEGVGQKPVPPLKEIGINSWVQNVYPNDMNGVNYAQEDSREKARKAVSYVGAQRDKTIFRPSVPLVFNAYNNSNFQ